jgi:ATP adenylyltransferase
LGGDILLQPGSLCSALERTTREALRRGALRPIATEQLVIKDAGVRFLARMVSSLRRKEAERHSGAGNRGGEGRARNPFLPPEPELTVTQISRSHLAVLNKFNVLDRHLLIVTRRFEHQETLLSVDDFRALLACMDEYPCLGFYNGGGAAGASQPHKHLQLVPLPLAQTGPPVPVEPLLEGAGPCCPGLPFAHAFARRKPGPKRSDDAYDQYLDLLARLGIRAVDRDGESRQSAPYNLLVTDGWMLVVPRRRECFRGVSINALGFAGSLFVKDRAQLELIRAEGPMGVLIAVAGPVDR